MPRNRRIPGLRWLLYGAGVAGLVRTTQEGLDQVGAEKEQVDPTTRAEPRDVHPRAVFLTGVGVLVVVWALCLVLYPLFSYFRSERVGGQRVPAAALPFVPPEPPQPRNEDHPYDTLAQYMARQKGQLTNYFWVDRGKGLVAIPIEEAIRIIAQRGIPPPPEGGETQPVPQAGDMRTGFERKVEPTPR